MKKVIKENYKIILGIIIGLIISVSGVYAATTIIQAVEVSYNNHEEKYTTKSNVQDSIDELYERSGIHKEIWQDPVLKESGNYPVISNGLVPVEIKPNGDTYYANLYTEWYSYGEKRWANAVILNDNAKDKYTTGQKISESDIKGYFVWIPRYSYKIWNIGDYENVLDGKTLTNRDYNTSTTQVLNKSRIIGVKFVGIDKIETGRTVNTYLTHPAFTLGNKELKGIWVGKFETGGTNTTNMVVKPNVTSWQGANVKTFFEAGKSFASSLDSHMMKNTEWGAVAYLSHSQYGIGNEVNINNASDYYTGYSAAPNTDQSSRLGTYAIHTKEDITQPWNTSVGYLASTTGNISGVYDMSGGAWEHMAACIEETPGNSGIDVATLTKEMENGYIDKYSKDSTITSYNKRILGDATGEMGPFYQYYDKDGVNRHHNSWYGDGSGFIDSTGPWFGRGDHYSDGGVSGQFGFDRATGAAIDGGGFRLVLSPTK